VETPTTVAAGVVLTVFGGALLLWCAVELRLRHHLRRHGIPATARVVADGDPLAPRHDGAHDARGDAHDSAPGGPYGGPSGGAFGQLDSAPLLAFTAGRSGRRELRAVEDGIESGESVLARPRGHTPLRRPSRLVPGALVQVAYDPRRPTRVVLAAHEDVPTIPADLFWALLGTSVLAGGLTLLTSALAGSAG